MDLWAVDGVSGLGQDATDTKHGLEVHQLHNWRYVPLFCHLVLTT
jgi:hypothetical protein